MTIQVETATRAAMIVHYTYGEVNVENVRRALCVGEISLPDGIGCLRFIAMVVAVAGQK